MNWELVIGIFCCTGFWSFVTKVYETKQAKKKPTEEMILAIGRVMLNELCDKYLKLGYIPKYENATFKKLGQAYISNGGNTDVKERFEICKKLEVK